MRFYFSNGYNLKCMIFITFCLYFDLATTRRLCTRTISVASVLSNESRLWLDGIYRRLSGRVSIRKPYQGEVLNKFYLTQLSMKQK